jgi:hypothetical protein
MGQGDRPSRPRWEILWQANLMACGPIVFFNSFLPLRPKTSAKKLGIPISPKQTSSEEMKDTLLDHLRVTELYKLNKLHDAIYYLLLAS